MDVISITSTTIAELDQDVETPDWLLNDLAAIHTFLINNPYAFECERVRDAQSTWSCDDGEAA